MRPGVTVTLTIDKPVAGGRMLARRDGAVVLVAGALPGEVVEARIDRVHRGTAWASVVTVCEASPDRIGESGSCGGTVLAHARYPAQLRLKQQIIADGFARVARLRLGSAVPIEASPTDGYRMRARLHVEGRRLGFYHEGTHRICDPGPTRQLLPETVEIIGRLSEALAPMPGAVVGVDLAENRDASHRVLHLDLARAADPSRLGSLTWIDGLTGVSAAHAGSARSRILWGTPRVADTFIWPQGTWTLQRDTRAFFQGNRYLVDTLARAVADAVDHGPVVDLYAGVGLFSAAVAVSGKGPVTSVEGDAVSAEDLTANARVLGGTVDTRHEAVESFVARRPRSKPATAIVDPPRAGLSKAALRGVAALEAARLVYVSCDVSTLARDTRGLIDAGYGLERLQAFDLFPNTAHVEVVAIFQRRAG
jgi:23S rRNA (uracil1939-C5)-methyltransferase